jgi:subtilase family serine protease
MIRRIGLSLLTVVVGMSLASLDGLAQTILTHHVREAALSGQAQTVGRLPANQVMQLDVVLPLRDPAALEKFLNEIYDPASPTYRHFLTVSEFTEKFGPTQEDYDAVVKFAKSNGFTVVGGSRDGMEVQIKGPVSAVESAFHVSMHTYQHPTENRIFYGPDREPTTSLSFALWHVSGLDNYSIPHAMYVKKSDYAAAHGIAPDAVVKHATTGSGPSASFLGSDMRAAYYGGTALTGAGQNLGLLEFEGTDLADLDTYYKNVGQTLPITPVLLSTDGTSTACLYTRKGGDCDDTEQTLDMTQALGMAPGLASLTLYIGSTDTAMISAMTTHSPLPATIGCSWGWTPADPTTLDPYFEKMAAQGQNFFAASGDDSTWSSRNEAWPADDANVVSVGGTDLVTASAAGAWKSETAWADSGGGISPDAAISSGVPTATIWPPPEPPFGAHVDDPVGGLDDVEIVLDDDQRAAAVDELAEGGEELGDIVEVQAGGGLVEDVECGCGLWLRLRAVGVGVGDAARAVARCEASLTRWASPPESVVADWPRRT